MRKFYKVAEAGTAPGGYMVRLDGKPVKTPVRNHFILPTQALAEAIAAEWAAQADEIKPSTMPLTQLANTMIDKARGHEREAMNEQLVQYGSSDLVCYFATHPTELVKRHEAQWRPLIEWMKERYNVSLDIVSGIQYHPQPATSIEKLRHLIAALPPDIFTLVQAATGTTGSVVIALALVEDKITPEEAYAAACIDEIYQLETWGADEAAQKRLDIIRSELATITRFKALLV